MENSAEGIIRLQHCLNDLTSILALRAIGSGRQPSLIVETLLDTVFSMLRLDLAYIRLNDPIGGAPIESVRTASHLRTRPEQICEQLHALLGNDPQVWTPLLTIQIEGRNTSLLTGRLGMGARIGLIIAGSQRAGFPQQTENLLLGVATNQASIALQDSILNEQTRVVTELDQKVAQRSAELAAINQELRKEVAERRLTEERLRRSEVFLREGQELSQTGSFSWRVATGEITWSEQLYRIYELEVGAPVTLELVRTRAHPEDITFFEKMIEQARIGSRDFEWHYRLLMPDQSIKYLHAVAHAIRDEDGRLEYIAAIQDVTACRLSEEARNKARSEFAHVAKLMSLGTLTASIAHELNQPLAGIVTNASTCLRMLASDPPNVDGARETARRTIRDGNRASDVVTRLRALFSKKDPTTESVNLNDAAQEVIALSLHELQRNRITLHQDLADDLPAVLGDRIQLQQVILNLLRNAWDAMSMVNDRPRELLIRTQRDEADQVRLSIKDVGVGFDPQGIERLFDAFYTTKNGGMGIGLSVSRSIVENHHGRLWASLNDGPGATFSFSIPCRCDVSTAPYAGIRKPPATKAA